MVKLVDTPGLGPGALCHAGSSPAARKEDFLCVSFDFDKGKGRFYCFLFSF